ncbi:MAG: tetratricopeptide repeat protein, partial [Elusimicrobiota bacterium]
LALRLSYYSTQAGRLPEAVRVLETANARWPANDQIAYFLALGYDDTKQAEKSIKLLRQVLTLKPGFRDARYQLGSLLEKAGRMEESEAEFRRLLADNPDDAAALNYLGYSLADRGFKLFEAEGWIREAVRLSPRNPAYWDSLGWVLHKQKRSTEAVAALEAAVAWAGDDATLWEHMGEAYSGAGSTAAAWGAWKRALALGDTSAAVAGKAAQAARGFDAEDMGVLYLEHLAAVHGQVRRLSAICRVEGDILGRRFHYDGMLGFRGPRELSLDILGPLFVPMFRIRLGAEGLAMDAIRVEGVDPDAVRAAVEGMFLALREYLSGAVFKLRPAYYRQGWWRRRLEAGGRRLELDRSGLRLAALPPPEGQGRLALEDFILVRGHLVPRKLTLSGSGYRLSLILDQVKVGFVGESK